MAEDAQKDGSKKADVISKSGALSESDVKKVQNSKGYYNVTFLKDHGTNKKDKTVVMTLSTANALAAHGVVKVGDKVTKLEKPKR